MTEPTDDEIMELAKPFIMRVGSHWENDDAIPDNGRIEEFARAVLAKFGTPTAEHVDWIGASSHHLLQPTQAQAGAVPLTHDEALDAFCHTPGIHQFVQAFVAGVRFAEQHHGIKGGQHG